MKKNSLFRNPLKLVLAVFGVGALSFTFTACDSDSIEEPSPLSAMQAVQEHGAIVPGKYIIVFKEGADFGLESAQTYERKQNQMRRASQAWLKGKGIPSDKLEHVYSSTIKGLSVSLSARELKELQNDPRVAYIEKDRVIQLAPPPGKGPNKGGDDGGSSSQSIPWGITRVGGAVDGTGKTAWVIDSGIDLDHPDLKVDVKRSRTFITSGKDATSADDLNGHGTHVAGTIAALDNEEGVVGVAAGATVVAVKVLDRRGSGSYSGVIAGVDHVGANGEAGDVANMSLGGPVSNALDNAVKNAASKGIKFSLAAGNDGANANNSSPARANGTNIYTISAINSGDVMASWSNWGNPPVDYAAPGVSIKSTWKSGGYNTISGTSMAAPHVAGILLISTVKTSGYAISDPDGDDDPIAHK